MLVNTTTADEQQFPSVSGLAGGGYVVAWQSENQDGSSSGVYAQRYVRNTPPAFAAIPASERWRSGARRRSLARRCRHSCSSWPRVSSPEKDWRSVER